MRFSIITTTFNSIKTIKNCIKSLNSQNYADIQLIWIDNNSSDGTYEYLQKNRTPNTKLIKVKDTKIVEAWNLGIDQSEGDVICFLNSDDQYFSEKYQTQKAMDMYVRSQYQISILSLHLSKFFLY